MTQPTDLQPPQLGKSFEEVLDAIDTQTVESEALPTGFPHLDVDLDGGFYRKELIVLGGHTGIGKSYLASTWMWNFAEAGFRSAYFSLEISNEMVVSRMLGSLANVKPSLLRLGRLNSDELESSLRARAEMKASAHNMTFYDQIYSLEHIAKETKKYGYDFIIVDFIQNVIAPGTDEYSRLSHAALNLQKLAKEANCCILILSQLSNAAAKEGGTQVLEYKGSGSIATVADLGFVIVRTDWTQTNTIDHVTLRLRKNRRGFSNRNYELQFQQPGGAITEVGVSNADK